MKNHSESSGFKSIQNTLSRDIQPKYLVQSDAFSFLSVEFIKYLRFFFGKRSLVNGINRAQRKPLCLRAFIRSRHIGINRKVDFDQSVFGLLYWRGNQLEGIVPNVSNLFNF
ncbi:MAG: hypothetical protein OXC03_07650 [Flavobacteriaceae bacterium]|nr:hypothetical protein [Flavobacteriaceae bacterium]